MKEMRIYTIISSILIISCTRIKKEVCINEPDQIVSFMVYNAFDSMLVQVFPLDSLSQMVIVGRDTVTEQFSNERNYALNATNTHKQIFVTRQTFDLVQRFTDVYIPRKKVFTAGSEIEKIKHFKQFRPKGINWKKYLHGLETEPDSAFVQDGDFDHDGKLETMVCVAAGETGYVTFLEQEKDKYVASIQIDISTMHYGIEYPIYNPVSGIFLFRTDRWGSCLDFDMFTIGVYAHDSLVFGPELSINSSAAINCDPDTGSTYVYYIGLNAKCTHLSADHFCINNSFSMTAYNWKTEESFNNLFFKQFRIEYFFDRQTNRFMKKGKTNLDTETNYFSENFRFMDACEKEIKALQKHGSAKMQTWLKDLDYFAE